MVVDGAGGAAREAFELGDRLARDGELEQAEEAYRRADDAGHPRAPARVGVFLELRGDLVKARAAYERADQRGDRTGAFRLGMLLASAARWDEAREAWARAEERGEPGDDLDLAALLRSRAEKGLQLAPQSQRSALASPVLVGAVTILVALIAVFLSYNANQGLPFVPTKQLNVQVADGSNLVAGNDVREGGFRIGLISNLKPIELPNGQVGAELQLKLDENHSRVPVDSTVQILPRSVLGTKYVELTVGSSPRLIPDGGTLPIGQTSVPVQFDDIFKTFDARTRKASQDNLVGYGDTFAARGSALNDTIASLPALLGHLQPVAHYLSQPSTQLTRFFDSLERFMGAVAPVAGVNSQLFTDMATTFEAISRDPVALESTIAQSPPTLDVSTDSLRVQEPFLVDLTTFGGAMTPATRELGLALPNINPAIEAGTRTLKRTPVLNAKLQDVMNALKSLSLSPGTDIALNALTATVDTLNPMIRYLGPFVTVCNGWNNWWTNLAEHISEETQFGFAQRALLNFPSPAQSGSVGSLGATQPVNGGIPDSPPGSVPEFLHNPNYPAAIDNAGNADCESGQRGYVYKLNHLDPQGRLLETDPHVPGDQGPTWTGLSRVPPGETFSRNPTTGPQLARNPSNP